jgi:hypothetical protein
LNLRLCRDSHIVTYSSLVTHRSNHPRSHHQCHRISNQTPTLPIPPNSLPRILRRVPHIATQSLSALPRRIEPGSLELTRLSWIRILDALTSRRERRRLVDLPDTARTAKTASRYDLNLRACNIIFVCGQSDVAITLPARQDGGWGVVAVWAGSGIEGTWEDGAEDDVGVTAAG